MVKPIPDGYHTVTPSFMFKDCKKAVDFYKKAFGAEALDVFPSLDGRGTMHAVIKIGNSLIMMGDEMPGMRGQSAETMGGSPVTFYIYVPDADQAFQKAVAAGCKADMPVMDMFWGDRAGNVLDPFGHSWMLATHKQDLTKDQVRQGAEAFFSKMAKK